MCINRTKHMFSCGKNYGFTLTEIMVVVAIISIMAAVGVAGFFTMRPTKNMHADGRDLLSNIQRMKLEAVRRNVCVALTFQPVVAPNAGGGYRIFIDDGGVGGAGVACDAIQNGGEAVLFNVQVRDRVALTLSPVAATAADNDLANLFSAISVNNRAMIQTRLVAGNFVLKNNSNPAQATLWLRVVARTAGNAQVQTNTNPANEGNWSR